ncbi:hypothetical protein PsorP6_005234 [Peronosclerospora sorghi]|uniref:Uncharacterized protein n=1 Tax=Peronosclerospora sorghi TaxID=230839 RepID=A0ACC0W4C0_9STRA|nr:hypothetical protein PsorP6_005234 [Peronosclerospora sorghi]
MIVWMSHAQTIVEEVLRDSIYDLAAEVFEEEEEKFRTKELSPELLDIVEHALDGGPMNELVIQKYNVDITRRHLQCLLPAMWLNDEVINFYFQLMNDRDQALVKAGVLSKPSHFFNSFFYAKVSENGYNFINIDLFAMDKVFMPINIGNMHWCMAVIFMTEKRIQYYDSMHGSGASCINILMRFVPLSFVLKCLVAHGFDGVIRVARYLHDESDHKRKKKFDEEGWELVTTTPETPLQTNGYDCGVFSCIFADFLSQNLVRPSTGSCLHLLECLYLRSKLVL